MASREERADRAVALPVETAATTTRSPPSRTARRALVCYDRDADGRFTAGDTFLAEQVVQVGGLLVRMDGAGRYVRWNVAPYDVAYVRIHPNAVADPALTPAQPEHRLRPVSIRAITVDFPVVQTRLSGNRWPDGRQTRSSGGSTLELRDERGEVTTATTFADGAWYVVRARPGRYTVSVAASSLAAPGAGAAPVELAVSGEGDAEVQAPTIQIRRATEASVAVEATAPVTPITERTGGNDAEPPCCCSWPCSRRQRAARRIGGSADRRIAKGPRCKCGIRRAGTESSIGACRHAHLPRCGASPCSSAGARGATWPRIPTAPVSPRRMRRSGCKAAGPRAAGEHVSATRAAPMLRRRPDPNARPAPTLIRRG